MTGSEIGPLPMAMKDKNKLQFQTGCTDGILTEWTGCGSNAILSERTIVWNDAK